MATQLEIHFLNVGHGDCTVVRHPSGNITVVDTSNGEAIDDEVIAARLKRLGKSRTEYEIRRILSGSARRTLRELGADIELTNPVAFVKARYPGSEIFRYIQTHPELDHMRGIKALAEDIGFANFWDTDNSRTCDPQKNDVDDWNAYQKIRKGSNVHRYIRGNQYAHFAKDENDNAPGDGIEILSPTKALTKACDESEDWNNMSIVIRITYGNTSIILGGDAEDTAWNGMIEQYGIGLRCNVYKASHHGRKSGYSADAMRLLKPDAVVLSIADECEHEAIAEYERHCNNVWSTYDKGNISLFIDGTGQILYRFARAEAA